MGKKVLVKHEGGIVGVPLSNLYVDIEDTESVMIRNRYPVMRYEEYGDKFTAYVLVNHIEYHIRGLPITRSRGNLSSIIEEDELRVLVREIERLGGYRFKTETGILMRLKGDITNSGLEVDVHNTVLLNPLNVDIKIKMPNIYSSGQICWGEVTTPYLRGLDSAGVILQMFMTSEFNTDLINYFCRSDQDKKRQLFDLLEEKNELLGEDGREARENYIRWLNSDEGVNIFAALDIATIFDLDNVKVEYLLEG